MKKIYQTPKTESVQMLGQSAIMVGSPGGFVDLYEGTGKPGGID